MVDWERHLDHFEETMKYGAITVAYFILTIAGFAFQKIDIRNEGKSKLAGYNVIVLFVVMQCACKAYGGNAGLAIYLLSSVLSFLLLPGVLEWLTNKAVSKKKRQ